VTYGPNYCGADPLDLPDSLFLLMILVALLGGAIRAAYVFSQRYHQL
jgi:hypothetical protein